MRDGSYVDVSDHYPPDDSVRVWSSQELRGYVSAAAADWPGGAPGGDLPPWVHVRLTFGDGAALDVLAAASEGRIVVDDPRVEAAPEPPHPWPGDFDGSYGYGGYIGYGGYDDPPREAVPAPAPVPLAEPVPPP
ncbi:DUF6214 family protein, partial [Streptomyces luteocolor]|uniref:DUF6214 family protein n=1 Tax=Streptomyces luteocolor TaxID=285500 RepID=UPI001EDBCBE8